MLCRVHKKPGGEGAQLREWIQTDQRDIPYHVTSCPVCDLRGAGWGREAAIVARGWTALVGRWWAVVSFVFLGFFSFPFFPLLHFIIIVVIIISIIFIVIIKLCLLQPTSSFALPILSPVPQGWGEWVSGCVVFSCWLRLNHDTRVKY